MFGDECVIIIDVQFCSFTPPFRSLCNCDRHQEMSVIQWQTSVWTKNGSRSSSGSRKWSYLFTPLSTVSSTSVDASCTNVRALALEKPEIADDSESDDRRDWSMLGTTNRGPLFYWAVVMRNTDGTWWESGDSVRSDGTEKIKLKKKINFNN